MQFVLTSPHIEQIANIRSLVGFVIKISVPEISKRGEEVGRGKASRTSSTPSEPRLREC